MSQKALTDFFHPRKRPPSVKDLPTNTTNTTSYEGQDEVTRKAKRLKRGCSGSSSGASSSSVGTGVKFYTSKEQLLMSLGSWNGADLPAKSDAKQTQLKRLSEKMSGFHTSAQNLKSFESARQELIAKESINDFIAATYSSSKNSAISASHEQNMVKTFATQRSVQRNLFGDDDGETTELCKRPSSDAVQRESLPVMSPQKMKESLMNCNKIGQLKERLKGYNEVVNKLKGFQAANELAIGEDPMSKDKQTLEFEITSPVKTAKKTIKTPSPKKTAAYQRFRHLLHDAPSTLALPYKYRFLKEAFHCLDTVASFLHNRKEIITFKKLKSSVREMLNKNLTEAQLAQIKTIFPFAYVFKREKNLPNHKVTPNNKNKWQLTVEVNTNYEAEMKACAADSVAELSARGTTEYRKLSPAMLLERGRVFHASLLNLLLQHHQEFLQQLEPPVTVDPACVTRWHPEFPIDSVPDIPTAELPKPPLDESGGTARDVLERARGVFSRHPHLRDTLEAVAGPAPAPAPVPAPATAEMESEPGPSCSESAPVATASRLPSGLLQRIRAREAARQQRLMTRTPAESHRLAVLGRLPQLARSLRATFVTERRATLPLETLLARLADSSRGLAECDNLGKHVELLVQEAPQFVHMLQLKSGTFVKMMKDVDVNAVVKSLENKLEKRCH